MLCKTCGRRPSERHDTYDLDKDAKGTYDTDCPDPIHRAADLGPEAVALLRSEGDVRDGDCHGLALPNPEPCDERPEAEWCWPCRARALLARLEGKP